MERHNITLQKRTRVMSESASGRRGITTTSNSASTRSRNSRSRLLSESAATKDRKALHTHSAPFSLLGSTSRQHKAKEERRCMLTASERKQKDIRDPEEFLLRSVLVNNTVRQLNKDARKEKAAKRTKAVSRVRL